MKYFALLTFGLLISISTLYAQNKENKQEGKVIKGGYSINADTAKSKGQFSNLNFLIQPQKLAVNGIPNAYRQNDDSVILHKYLDPKASVAMPGTEILDNKEDKNQKGTILKPLVKK